MKKLLICLSLLTIFVNNCLAVINERCMELENMNCGNYSNCETQLVENNTYLQTQCLVYAVTETQLSIMPNSVVGISISFTLRTKLPLILNSGSFPNQCTKIVSGNVNKLNSKSDLNLALLSKRYVIDQNALIPLMAVDNLNLRVSFRAEKTVGAVTYDSNCIQKFISKASGKDFAGNLVVSGCIRSVAVMESVDRDVGYLPWNFKITQLIESNAFTATLNHFKWLWLKECDEIIRGITLTLYKGFAFPNDAFMIFSQQKIEALYLPNNEFESIKAGDFPNIPMLKVLDLSNCRLITIDPAAFDRLPNLQELNLAGNLLSEIPRSVEKLNKLEILNLSSNKPEEINSFNYSSNILRKLTRLRVLDLSKTNLASNEEISGDAPTAKLEYFTTLNISETYFQKFSESFRSLFPNLRHLMASGNRLRNQQIKSIIENQWKNLTILDLSNNHLGYDSDFDKIFQQFPSLKYLDLSGNQIGQILSLKIPFDTENDLRFVNLSTNEIYTWSEPALNLYNSSALEVDLSQNNITEVSAGMLIDFNKLKFVHLERNPFDCRSCSLESFQHWIAQTKSLKGYNSSRYVCAFPKEDNGKFIEEIVIDPSLCIFNWILLVLVPVLSVGSFIGIIIFLAYYYRWYIRYFWHLFRAKVDAAKNAEGELQQVYRYDAFVSYCSHDVNWVVQQLIPNIELKEPKLHLCVHERDFEIGGTIINNVIDCIDSSKKSIFLISRNFIKSQWCQWELQMAQHKLFDEKKDVLVLIMLEELEDSQIPNVLKRLIKSRTYLFYPDPTNAAAYKLFWSRLRQAIGQCRCIQEQIKEQEEQLLIS